ncbi:MULTISPECIES: tyrosine-type recombinase/integrase [Eubacteriales]|uniref:Site-specific recombinase XerD n=1 Tax=Bittarella massiliensis (ex Durand et al. 2017) TaxID=1720313 RepID=A0AAQ1RVY0_9FIRM|nr:MULTISPECIES: tyrosine-type recombinase/integrase [Eubacteriales]ERJ01231.1 phage integrase, SAM-like domain protein [Clostridium sp. ATCC 29733]MZL69083.1 tyrosine-type recombinase/integrase [Bittarella massiliensis (ex Durand et al. 2017)]SHG11636.1 Site-specific recombinase XerD [Bittarella massiliensis (ex Durand et al. 2017)]
MKGRILTSEAIDCFKKYLREEEKSENTIEKYLRDVRAFAAYLKSAEITKEAVIAYKNKLLSENYAVRSINSMLASLNNLFVFLGWADCRVKSIKVQRQIYCPEEKELTKAEYMRLVSTAKQKGNERLNLILQTICGTGIRVSELQYITVEAVECGEVVVSLKGKIRSVFIVKELKKKLLRYAAEQKIKNGVIFVTRTGKPISRTNIWREMKGLCEQAGVNPQKVFPHNLRHLFARVFYGIEKDIAKLADILGHSSINTTRIYIISTGDEHRKRMEHMRLII